MAPDKAPYLLRNGEGDHEVMTGKLSFYLIHQPLASLVVLAAGTVPVPARLINDVVLAARLTLVDQGSTLFGAAVDDGVYDLSVF